MRSSLWLLALTALTTGGCVLPCSNGPCSSSGEPRYVPPLARFMGSEKLMGSGCEGGRCQPKPYPTFAKYWPGMDKWTSTSMATRCANRYLLKQQVQSWTLISSHYKGGFRQAFVDVANGESGEVPPVPPPRYWNTQYRTERGKRCVELWFDGYRAGSVLAASELGPMKTIGASYDWSIEKPKSSRVKTTAIMPGVCITEGTQQGMQPSRFRMSQPQPASGIGPANSYPERGNYPPETGFDQNFNQFNQYPNSPGQFGATQGPSPGQHPSQGYSAPQYLNSNPGLSAPSGGSAIPGNSNFGSSGNLGLPSPVAGVPTPGYSSPGGRGPSSPASSLPFPQSDSGQTGFGSPSQNGPLTPGFSGQPKGQVLPGKLGPPDQFKSDPPVFQVSPPRR